MTNTYIPARPTTYDGIEMRSRLEARVAAYLDGCGIQWSYEGSAYATRGGQYLPDFVLTVEDGERLYLEVKGPSLDDADAAALLKRMSIIFASKPGVSLAYCSETMLRAGLFGFSFWGTSYWRWALMVRCPDHPDRCRITGIIDNKVAAWCAECDPACRVRIPVSDCSEFIVGEGDVSQ